MDESAVILDRTPPVHYIKKQDIKKLGDILMQIINGGNPYSSDRISSEYLLINSCGYHHITDTDFTTRRPAGRLDYQLIYLWSGCAEFILSKGPQIVHQGEIVVYKPGEPQDYTYYAKDTPQSYWIHFTGVGAEELLRTCGLWEKAVYTIGPCPEFAEHIREIIREIQLQPVQHNLFCAGSFTQLLAQVSRRLARQETGRAEWKFEKLIAVLESMHNDSTAYHSIEEYATQCHLSRSRFLHLFKQYTGLSPHAYVTRIRLEKAKDLLINTTLSVAEISRIVGYPDPLYFSRIFKKYTGVSPKMYVAGTGT